MEAYINKHSAVIQILGGVIATAVTLTAFAFSNFQTKEEHQQTIERIEKSQDSFLKQLDRRIERLEDRLNDN